MNNEELLFFLKQKKEHAERQAEECFQELENEEEGNIWLAKSEVFEQIINLLEADQLTEGLGF